MKRKQQVNTSEYDDNSSSLVARAAQIMAIIVTLGLVSMISSLLVAESLSGDAEQINRAGALRMQAVKISRAQLMEVINKDEAIAVEKNTFKKQLSLLSLGDNNETPNIIDQHHKILVIWQDIESSNQTMSPQYFDNFVITIDKLVSLLQVESEKKLSILRSIQGISVLLLLIFTSYILIKLNRTVIAPLKQLVRVSFEAGKGNFDVYAEYNEENELGLLSQTINQMSKELKQTYQDFEDRVDQKTLELRQNNQSLQLLYKAAQNLSNQEYQHIESHIITELEQAIGIGQIDIQLSEKNSSELFIYQSRSSSINYLCMNVFHFVLEKRGKIFGDIIWQVPKIEKVNPWQKQILQAMAEIIATAIELEHKKQTENRLLIAEERAIIARELHDSLAQSLSYLKVQMSLLTRKVQKDLPQEKIQETIEDIKLGLNNAYVQLRELLTTFRLKLDEPSLENALQGTIAEFSEKCQHPIKLAFNLPIDYLSANQEVHVLQIIREALSNVHRHANATQATVSLIKENTEIQIKICDNGVGFTKTGQKSGHLGLSIMEERAKSLKAKINIKSSTPIGTTVSLNFEQHD